MAAFFPNTNTAFQLASEYCTLNRIVVYIRNYDLQMSRQMPDVNTDTLLQGVLDSYYKMTYEIKKILAGNSNDRKIALIKTLMEYSNDERVSNFSVASALIIDAYNITFPDNRISPPGLTNYFKDGYIVAGQFKDTISPFIEEHKHLIAPSKDLKKAKPPRPDKLKVSLSVPQLALLFRLLYDHDPNILTNRNQLDLFDFISNHFTNEKSAETSISKNTLSNDFYSPKQASKDFWSAALRKMISSLPHK